ncbi:MAG: 3-phosphoglycerate dehydrogenase [Gammaproteobacteria bacterium]|nr:3-phosphoglycerate dehydrogenase [Gammaproteobacteria bacterium]
MYKVRTLNNISVDGLERLPRELYEVASELPCPDAVLVRSADMHNMEIPTSLKAIGRAGAGVNNIPVERCTEQGIAVFNAPGANANAVKELVLTGMLIAARNVCDAWSYVQSLEGDDKTIETCVESAKKTYVGTELLGHTLGIIGLGAIGVQVANAARTLGMHVIGYDPSITVDRAWQLSADVQAADSVDHVLGQSDFVSLHVPLLEETRGLISGRRVRTMRKGAVLLNFSRAGIVDDAKAVEALDAGHLRMYVCDFPTRQLIAHSKVIALPHLGASTEEAENNCAIAIAEQLRDYLERGNVRNSVNLPDAGMPLNGSVRLAIVHANKPNMLGQISTALAEAELNIVDMLNKSRGTLAYTLIDLENTVCADLIRRIEAIDGVMKVRLPQ